MFPVSDVIPSRTRPVVTIALLAVTAAAFLYELQLTQPELQRLVNRYGAVPGDLSWMAVLTSPFLHAGWLHVGANMLYLWIFGDNVEDAFGRGAYLLFYLLCGAAAIAGHVFANPHSSVPMIGASGAVAGVMGAYFVIYPRSRILTAVFLLVFLDLVEVPALFFLGIWFLMQLFVGIGSIGVTAVEGGPAVWAHISGFLAGAIAGAWCRWKGTRYWDRGAEAGVRRVSS